MEAMVANRSRKAQHGENDDATDEESQYTAEVDSQDTTKPGGGAAGVDEDQRRTNQRAAEASLTSLYAEIGGSGASREEQPTSAPPDSTSEHAATIAKHRRE